MGSLSLVLHIVLLVSLSLNLKPSMPKGSPLIYRVTLRPFSPPGNGLPRGNTGSSLPGPSTGMAIPPEKKLKSSEIQKKSEISKSQELRQKKTKKVEKGEVLLTTKKQREEIVLGTKKGEKKEEGPQRAKTSSKALQEAIEDLHKQIALEEIQKRVAQRGRLEKGTAEGQQGGEPFQGPRVSSSRLPGSGSGAGAGTGSGSGTGSGTGTGVGSGGASVLEAKLSDYYNAIWAKIKEEWTLPKTLPQRETELETIIVVVIEREGKIQKLWFEKRSGNALYDQMAMRAIRKAEPLPPIPEEFSDRTLEIGIRFYPD
jgi:colicin import membrane protein